MADSDSHSNGLLSSIKRVAVTGFAMLQNRAELVAIELQEENYRLVELFIWGMTACFLAMLFLMVLTGTIIFLFEPHLRIYVACGFCVLYLAGAILALLNLKALAKNAATPFSDTIAEVKKDREWLESLK